MTKTVSRVQSCCRILLVGLSFMSAGKAQAQGDKATTVLQSLVRRESSVTESDLLDWRDMQKADQMRDHAWRIFARITKLTPPIVGPPYWDTWNSDCKDQADGRPLRQRLHRTSLPLDLVGAFREEYSSDAFALADIGAFTTKHGRGLGEQISYNPIMCAQIISEHLGNNGKALDDRLRDFIQNGSPAREREIKPFPGGSIAVKAFWVAIAPDYQQRIKIWPDRKDPTCAPKYCVDSVVVKFAPRQKCNLPISGNTPVFSSCFYSVRDDNPGEKGYTLILVGLHVAVKEINDWTWSTFWWHPIPQAGTYAKGKAGIAISGVWRNFLMNTTFSTETPPEPEPAKADVPPDADDSCGQDIRVASRARVCFNPFLEGGLKNGALSNCQNCHARAAYPVMNPDPRSNAQRGYLSPDAACFDKDLNGKPSERIHLDYMWSLVPSTGGKLDSNIDKLLIFRESLRKAILEHFQSSQ